MDRVDDAQQGTPTVRLSTDFGVARVYFTAVASYSYLSARRFKSVWYCATTVHIASGESDCETATDGRMEGGAFDATGCGRIRQASGARQVSHLPRCEGRKRRIPGLRTVQEPDHRHWALPDGTSGGAGVRPQGGGRVGGAVCALDNDGSWRFWGLGPWLWEENEGIGRLDYTRKLVVLIYCSAPPLQSSKAASDLWRWRSLAFIRGNHVYFGSFSSRFYPPRERPRCSVLLCPFPSCISPFAHMRILSPPFVIPSHDVIRLSFVFFQPHACMHDAASHDHFSVCFMLFPR